VAVALANETARILWALLAGVKRTGSPHEPLRDVVSDEGKVASEVIAPRSNEGIGLPRGEQARLEGDGPSRQRGYAADRRSAEGGDADTDEVAAMLGLCGLGWGAKRIAAEFGCSRNTVRRYLWLGG
jgi:hypothetical protein